MRASDAIAFAVAFGLAMLVVGGLAWVVARLCARPAVVNLLGRPLANVIRWAVTALLVLVGFALAIRTSLMLAASAAAPDDGGPMGLLTAVLTSPLAWIALVFLLAIVLGQVSGRVARRVIRVRYAPTGIRPSREQTLIQLTASMITLMAFIVAIILSLATVMETSSLVWLIGLFSAALGIGVSPFVRDILAGVSFLFEDAFDIGDKVEMLGVEGVVEQINLRSTFLRAPNGEVYNVPNGEVRLIRNFSRGLFSGASLHVKLAAADLERALPLLERLGAEAPEHLPDLLEPWQVIADTGALSRTVTVLLVAKARFGTAAELRPRLMALVQRRLTEADIPLAD